MPDMFPIGPKPEIIMQPSALMRNCPTRALMSGNAVK
jgi:hypothetical protein